MEDIAKIRSRIAEVEAERHDSQVAGMEEKYLDACFLIEALEHRLGESLRATSAISDPAITAAAVDPAP